MGEHTNSFVFNLVAWAMSIIMIILTLVLVYAAIFEPSAAGITGSLMHPFRLFVPLWKDIQGFI